VAGVASTSTPSRSARWCSTARSNGRGYWGSVVLGVISVDVVVLGLDDCVLLLEELELVLVLLVVVGVQRRVSSLSTSQSPVSSQQALYRLRIGKFVGVPPSSESSMQFVRNELQTVFRQARWHMDVAQETPSQRLPHFE
jgi:hypothetical protein